LFGCGRTVVYRAIQEMASKPGHDQQDRTSRRRRAA
jgi:hypothetical protein